MDYLDAELENFEVEGSGAVAQTVRVDRPTAKNIRDAWLVSRRVDPELTYTEFASTVMERGLRALTEEREREN